MSRRVMLDTDIFSYVVNDRYAGLRERFMRDVEAICISSVTYADCKTLPARTRGDARPFYENNCQ